MEKLQTIKVKLQQLIKLLFIIILLIAFTYQLINQYYQFNFEEIDVNDLIQVLFYIYIFPRLLGNIIIYTIDFDRKMVIQKSLISKSQEINFDRIKEYKYNKFWGTISVFLDSNDKPLYIRLKENSQPFLLWLQENKPVQTSDLRYVSKWDLGFLTIFIPLTLIAPFFKNKMNDYARHNFPFKPVQTVELTGTYKKDKYPGLYEKGQYGKFSFELKEYPELEFNASSFLPDAILDKAWEGSPDSLVFLTVNKSDYDLLLHKPPKIKFKGTVRTYGIRTAQAVVLKKELSLLE
ncbi:MAG: hypothetical protein GC192_17250 [Bacteroidetes bacterium]|nr:hypothetical protein [Bacteroidota bacterium]